MKKLKKIFKYKLIFLYLLLNFIFIFATYYLINRAIENEIKFQNFINVYSVKQEFKNINSLIKNRPQEIKLNILKYLILFKRSLNIQGDMFVFDPKTKKVIFDASSDCKLPKSKSYLTKNNICSLFYSPESCVKAANQMVKNQKGFFKWYFYKQPEIVYFDSIYINNHRYVIANGSQINNTFYFDGVKVLIAIYFTFNLVLSILFIWIDIYIPNSSDSEL